MAPVERCGDSASPWDRRAPARHCSGRSVDTSVEGASRPSWRRSHSGVIRVCRRGSCRAGARPFCGRKVGGCFPDWWIQVPRDVVLVWAKPERCRRDGCRAGARRFQGRPLLDNRIGATYRIAASRLGFHDNPQQCNNEVRGTYGGSFSGCLFPCLCF